MHETLQITSSLLDLIEKTKKIKILILIFYTDTLKNGLFFKIRHFLSNFDQSGSISKQNSYYLHDLSTQTRKADYFGFQNHNSL